MVFENRQEAGKQLATQLIKYREKKPFILAMPRGGVPIAYEIAHTLHAPLDVIVVRKIGLSGNREFGIGAIAEGGVEILDQTTTRVLGIDADEIKDTIDLEEVELNRRVKVYRDGKPLPDLKNKTVILVDDGMATGITARAAIEAVKKLNPKEIILASPVCALDTTESLQNRVDGIVCLATPAEFSAVALWYKNFIQVTDEEVVNLLKKSKDG